MTRRKGTNKRQQVAVDQVNKELGATQHLLRASQVTASEAEVKAQELLAENCLFRQSIDNLSKDLLETKKMLEVTSY